MCCTKFSDEGSLTEKSNKFVKRNENVPEFKQKSVSIMKEERKNKKVFLGILGNERGGKKIKGSEDDEGTSLIADVKSC